MQFIQCIDSFDLIRFDSIHSFKKRHIDAKQKGRTLKRNEFIGKDLQFENEEERVHRAKDLQFRLLLMRKSGHLLEILTISPRIMGVDP